MIVSGVRGRLVRWARLKMRLTPVLGILSCACAVAGIGAWAGYARNAGAGATAMALRRHAEADHFVALAGWCGLTQMLLGGFAVGLAWFVWTRKGISRLDQWASGVGFFLGAVALLLMLLIV